jgi:hypothetical protein
MEDQVSLTIYFCKPAYQGHLRKSRCAKIWATWWKRLISSQTCCYTTEDFDHSISGFRKRRVKQIGYLDPFQWQIFHKHFADVLSTISIHVGPVITDRITYFSKVTHATTSRSSGYYQQCLPRFVQRKWLTDPIKSASNWLFADTYTYYEGEPW